MLIAINGIVLGGSHALGDFLDFTGHILPGHPHDILIDVELCHEGAVGLAAFNLENSPFEFVGHDSLLILKDTYLKLYIKTILAQYHFHSGKKREMYQCRQTLAKW